jgi:hypothetical protein
MVVVMGAAAAGGAGGATVAGAAVARLHVAHGRGVARMDRQVGRQVAGWVVRRANVAIVLLLQHSVSVTDSVTDTCNSIMLLTVIDTCIASCY